MKFASTCLKELVAPGFDSSTAGADLTEIDNLHAEDARSLRYLEDLSNAAATFRKPLIAAVETMAVRAATLRLTWTEQLKEIAAWRRFRVGADGQLIPSAPQSSFSA
jgi:hypothetical protein